jgi:hypothetical protein
MNNPYSISTMDSIPCKSLFCGRFNDLMQILDLLSNNNSIALFGERRIGKSLLLFFLRDIINSDIQNYKDQLLDETLKKNMSILSGKLKNCIPIFVSMHDLIGSNAKAVVSLLLNRLRGSKLLKSDNSHNGSSDLMTLFNALNNKLKGKRLIIMVDEVEVLLDDNFGDATLVFRNLRSIIQTYPGISFIFAGAEDWHKRIKERTSPLINNVRTFYLKSAALAEIEIFLIGKPFQEFHPKIEPAMLNSIKTRILDWTGSKPYYVQAVADCIWRNNNFDNGWENNVKKNVQTDIAAQLRDFYEKVDINSKMILTLLAHQPGSTVNDISRRLKFSKQKVWNHLSDLEALDKVRKEGSEYRITGTLIEEWGKINQDYPVPKPWPTRIRFMLTIIALIIAFWVFLYTHPTDRVKRFTFSEGDVRFTYPSNVEKGEEGNLSVAVSNKSKFTIPVLKVILSSDQVDFQVEGSNQLSVKELEKGVTRHFKMAYNITSDETSKGIPINIAVEYNNLSVSQFEMKWTLRRLPLKWLWGVLSPFFILLGILLQKDWIAQMIAIVGSKIMGKQLSG